MSGRGSSKRARVLVLHAHPDDEAIFTGGTLARLTDAGHEVILVFATSGEEGEGAGRGDELGARRRSEAAESARALGVGEVHFLQFCDSGLLRPGEEVAGSALGAASPVAVAQEVVATCGPRPIDALVAYDENGIYGHVDHVQVHLAGRLVRRLLTVPTLYEATVDNEYLHFVATHIVQTAGASLGVPLRIGDHLHRGGDVPRREHVTPGRSPAGTGVGVPTLLIDTALDVSEVLGRKRRALAAHASQLGPDSMPLAADEAEFAAVYGWEWYRRIGPAGVIDDLSR